MIALIFVLLLTESTSVEVSNDYSYLLVPNSFRKALKECPSKLNCDFYKCAFIKTGIINKDLKFTRIYDAFLPHYKQQIDWCINKYITRQCFQYDNILKCMDAYVYKTMGELSDVCKDELTPKSVGMQAILGRKGEMPETKDWEACAKICILKKIHILTDDNEFDREYIDFVKKQVGNVEDLVKKCAEKNLQESTCERVHGIFQCIFKYLNGN